VTPMDIAGARGLSRGFAVKVRRPQPPIRPAVGELRMVQRLRGTTASDGAQRVKTRPNDLEVYLALKDDAWDDGVKKKETFGNIEFTIDRIYRIVVDPEDLEP